MGTGVGFRLFFEEINEDRYTNFFAGILTFSLFGAIWCLYFIRAAHASFIFPWQSFAVRNYI